MLNWIKSYFREAVGTYVDDPDVDELAGFRRLTGDSDRDLAPMDQERMQRLAHYLWESNPLANRLIELPRMFILAEGVRLSVPNTEAQRWLDAFWNDPINCMALKLDKKVRELSLFGEQFWPAFPAPNGHVRLGYLDPCQISRVVIDPDNQEQPIGVITKKDLKGRYKKYRVIVNGGEDVFTRRTQGIRENDFTDGDIFYWTVNQLSAGARGRSDLLAVMDWLDGYDQFLFGELDRTRFLRDYIWDVSLTGADAEEVKRRARDIAHPKPGTVRIHNDREVWQAVNPQLHGEDHAEAARMLRNHIMGGQTIPEHWFGGAADVNKSTGEDMGIPTFKAFTDRQTTIRYILEQTALYVIRQRRMARGEPEFEPGETPEEFKIQVEFPEVSWRDTSQYASGIQQSAQGLALYLDKGIVSESVAAQILGMMAKRLGVDVNTEVMLDEARAELEKRREEDVFELTDGNNPRSSIQPGATSGTR